MSSAANRLDLALPLFVENLELRKAKLGADHPNTVMNKPDEVKKWQAERAKYPDAK